MPNLLSRFASIPPCERWPSSISPTPGPGVFAEEMRARGVELDEWRLAERGTGPPVEIADYDAVLTFGGAMHADQEDRHPWLRFEKDLLARAARRPACRCSPSASARSCWPRRAAARRGGRASRRSAGTRSSSPPEGRADPLLGAAGAALRGVPVAQLRGRRCRQARRRSPAARSACRPTGSASAPGGSSSTPRSRAADADAWIADYRSDEDAVRIGVDPDALRRRDGGEDRRLEPARPGALRALPDAGGATRASRRRRRGRRRPGRSRR